MRFQSWNLLLAVRKGLGFKKDDTLRSRMKIPVSVMAFPEIVWSLLLSAGPSLPVNSHSIDFPYSLAILNRILAPGFLQPPFDGRGVVLGDANMRLVPVSDRGSRPIPSQLNKPRTSRPS